MVLVTFSGGRGGSWSQRVRRSQRERLSGLRADGCHIGNWLARPARKHWLFPSPCKNVVANSANAVDGALNRLLDEMVDVETAMLRLAQAALHHVPKSEELETRPGAPQTPLTNQSPPVQSYPPPTIIK